MQKVLKFICCSTYDFTDDSGKRISGISCKCFDPDIKQIIKVKTDTIFDAEFGDEILVDVIFNGRYVNYKIA